MQLVMNNKRNILDDVVSDMLFLFDLKRVFFFTFKLNNNTNHL